MIKIGEQAVVAINEGKAALRFARRRLNPEKVYFYVHNCGVEEAAGPMPPLPVAQGWLSIEEARMLESLFRGNR